MTDKSDPFTAMATRIERNEASEFGGACVIVLPDGQTVELLVVDAEPQPAQFIGTISARLQLLLGTLEDAEGRRR